MNCHGVFNPMLHNVLDMRCKRIYNAFSMASRRRCRKLEPGTPCGYCFENWATGYDHLVPVSYGGRNVNEKSNLYPSCKRCNSILSNLMFATLEAKREYVRQRLIEKGKWHLPVVQPELPQGPPAPEVLQLEMPVAILEPSPPVRQVVRPRIEAPKRIAGAKGRITHVRIEGCLVSIKTLLKIVDRAVKKALSEWQETRNEP